MYPYALVPGFVGNGLSRAALGEAAKAAAQARQHAHDDVHLRSCKAVTGYHIHASNGEVGHVCDLLVDEQTWAIRYLVVDTSNWWLGHKVLIAPQWIDAVRWIDQSVTIDLDRQTVQGAPVYESTRQLNREREIALYRHYDRPVYW
jgi:sporulation protein YlmC with PRC-barrel domain